MVDKETHFSSFFMLLLSATSLVVILSNFFSGNFNQRTNAETNVALPMYEDMEYVESDVEETMSGEELYQEDLNEEMYEESLEGEVEESPDLQLNQEVEVGL